AKRVEMGTATERSADVFAERADVGALAAAHVDIPQIRLAVDDANRIDAHRARGALDLDAGAGVFVQRLAVALEGRVHRRDLLDHADEAVAGGLQSPAVDGDAREGSHDFAFAVAGGR